MKVPPALSLGQWFIGAALATLLAGCGSISINAPAQGVPLAGAASSGITVATPVRFEVSWKQAGNLQFLIDGHDRTSEFAPITTSPVIKTIVLEPGPHSLEVWADVDCSYCTGGSNRQSTRVDFTAQGTLSPDPASLTFAVGETRAFTVARGGNWPTPTEVTAQPRNTNALALSEPYASVFAGRPSTHTISSSSSQSFPVSANLPGQYVIDLTAPNFAPAQVNVTVNPQPVTPPAAAYSLSVQPVTVQRSHQGTLTVLVSRNLQMTDPVTFTPALSWFPLGVFPHGISITDLNPVAVGATTSQSFVNVDSSATAGTYHFTVTGTAGSASAPSVQTATGTLVVSDVDPHSSQPGRDCDCHATGDWVTPALLVEANEQGMSPDGAFTLTPNAASGTVSLHRASPACDRSFGPFNDPHVATHFAFSPHSKYFVITQYSSSLNNVTFDFYDLTTCSPSPVAHFVITAFTSPIEGTDAGWGFGPYPDDSTVVLAGKNSAMNPEVTLANVRTNQSTIVSRPMTEATWTFSPCGDLFAVKSIINLPQAKLVFDVFRTLDFTSVPVNNATVDITTTYRDADLTTDPQGHRLKRVLVSTGEPEADSLWPQILANGAAGPCPP